MTKLYSLSTKSAHENTVNTVVENEIKEEEHKEVENTPVGEKKSIKKLFKKKK